MTKDNNFIKRNNESSNANTNIAIEDLSCEEKTLSLVSIKCLTKEYPNDYDLGREIRKIFNNVK
jgi:hypothetical protein